MCYGKCENEAIFDTNVCESCLESAAIKNLENFGVPEKYTCGNCGQTFASSDFGPHLYGGNCQESY